jgi:hypothetical protein
MPSLRERMLPFTLSEIATYFIGRKCEIARAFFDRLRMSGSGVGTIQEQKAHFRDCYASLAMTGKLFVR